MRLYEPFAAALLHQRGRLMPWSPVMLAAGIGLFFSLPFEPSVLSLWITGVLALGLVLCALRSDAIWGPVFWALALVALGFVFSGQRAHAVAGPVLEFRFYGTIEGTVVGLDRSASDAVRVTLKDVILEDVPAHRTPTKVRISLHGGDGAPPAGARVMTTGHLNPPGGPVEPGGFDFQRHTWFLGIGAIGYTRVPLLLVDPAPNWAGVFGARMGLSSYVQAAIPGDAGGFAAAVTTGDRSAMSSEAVEALRITNLAHLLAISGLHMGLLTGFVFATLRFALALLPMALLWPTRKIAAAGALAVGAVYLALSGGNIATERAFIMVAVAFSAILLDRRAISLRSVAVAAIIVLVMRPEALLGPGFQMSFAATTALVAIFALLSGAPWAQVPKWAQPVMAVVVSSGVAGLATLPVAAAHFNRMASYGLIANLAATPVMGTIVVPAGVLAALLAPLGLDGIGFWIMEQGLAWILFVANGVASWEGSSRYIPAPPPVVLPLMSLGALMVVLILGRGRYVGVLPVVVACGIWAAAERPAVLIADGGTLVGVMTPEGRALSKARGAGFVANSWLENDGAGLTQERAAALWSGDGRLRAWDLGDHLIIHANGKRALAELETCPATAFLVASVPVTEPWACQVLDPDRLRGTGAIALDAGMQKKTARQIAGTRLWNTSDLRRARQTSGAWRQYVRISPTSLP
ncbi:ComEC/Rec2 family competence protein [Primorskyibacter sp. S187A]|uniref:ComEC/Rec2 family competence protein n=1 Tax=Primorskyibacter sp. S187A TaxID=3415130 RepID=UPI003C7CDE55